jgi:hypothetical protein
MALFAFFAGFVREKPALDGCAAAGFSSVADHPEPMQKPERFIDFCAGSMPIEHFDAYFRLCHAIGSVSESG